MHFENIVTIFDGYLKNKSTEYAVLLNGKWGSGKTYFWKHTLVQVIEKNNLTPIYVSLNGIKDLDSLEKKLFIKLLPILGKQQNKKIDAAINISKNIFNKITKAAIKIDFSDVLKGVSIDVLNFDKSVICFDDLERCQIPLKQLLGYINDFVEHQSLKCLVLADEDKIQQILNKDEIGYNGVKEKIIGRVLNYHPDLNLILPLLYKKFEKEQDYLLMLEAHNSYFLELLLEFNVQNLRIVSFILENLNTVLIYFKNLDKVYQKEIILFTTIISIEFKKGRLTSNDYKNYKLLDNLFSYSFSIIDSIEKKWTKKLNQDKDEKYKVIEGDDIGTVVFKLYLKNRISEYHFYPSIYTFILSGFFDNNLFKKDIDSHILNITLPVRNYKKIVSYDFRKISNQMFIELSENVMKNAENGIYDLYDYERIADFYYFFSKENLIELSIDQIRTKLLKGIKKAAQRKEINSHSYSTMQNFDQGKRETKDIREQIYKNHRLIELERQKANSDDLVILLKNGNISQMIQMFKKNELNEEFLINMNVKKISLLLFEYCDNEVVYEFNRSLYARYDYANPGSFVKKDKTFLLKLKTNLDKYIENNETNGNVKKLNLKELSKNLEIWDDRLEKKNHIV